MAYSKATFNVRAVEACHCLKLFSVRIYKRDRQRITEALSRNTCSRGRAKIITYSDCVFLALGIQHATRKRRVKLSSVTCPILPYLSALSHKRNDFRENIMGYKMCVLFFPQLLSETFLILRRIPRDINLHRSSCRQPDILSGFNKNLIFSTHFRKIHKYQFP
jgi:hypothetical protein